MGWYMAPTCGEFGAEKKTGWKSSENEKTSCYYPLSGEQAVQVLAILADKDEGLAEKIAKLSAQIYCDVSPDRTASLVYRSLDGIAVENCWDASGRQHGGG
ncbi:MAG: hypothetical protein AB7S52_03270 [Sphaerochaetaceae bacterium]